MLTSKLLFEIHAFFFLNLSVHLMNLALSNLTVTLGIIDAGQCDTQLAMTGTPREKIPNKKIKICPIQKM